MNGMNTHQLPNILYNKQPKKIRRITAAATVADDELDVIIERKTSEYTQFCLVT
jgi:hypothetical protein